LRELLGFESPSSSSAWKPEIPTRGLPLLFKKIRQIRGFFFWIARTYFPSREDGRNRESSESGEFLEEVGGR
jgi:hypothetical protein